MYSVERVPWLVVSEFQPRLEEEIFCFPYNLGGPWGPFRLCRSDTVIFELSLKVRRPGRCGGHPLLFSAKIKKDGSSTSNLPLCLEGVFREDFYCIY
jgi:hypothetical protein